MIRGNKGTKFESTEADNLGEEVTDHIYREAERVLDTIKGMNRSEVFEIVEVRQ